jgi:hypothetical protein
MLHLVFKHVSDVDWRYTPVLESTSNSELVTILQLIVCDKGRSDQDEKEWLSAMRFMLEQKSDPNQKVYPISLYPSSFSSNTLFELVIRQGNARVVRLFREHGATLPEEVKRPLIMLWNKFPLASDVLKELIPMIGPDVGGRNRGRNRGRRLVNTIQDELIPASSLSHVDVLVLATSIQSIAHGASGALGIVMRRWRKAFLVVQIVLLFLGCIRPGFIPKRARDTMSFN